MALLHSFLWLTSVPFVYMYHIFSNYLSADGHLGCLHVLALINSAAMNIRMHVSFQSRVFSGYMLRSGIAGSHGNSVLSFLRNCILFSIVAIHQFTFLATVPSGRGNGSPLQYSCLENSMDRGVLWATVHGVTESDTTEGLTHTYILTV